VVKKKESSVDEIRKAALQPLPPVQAEAPKPKAKPRKKHRLIPRHEWCLIRKTSLDEEHTEAGLILNREQVKLHQGVIVALGRRAQEAGLEVGMKVLYSAFGMDLDDVELLTGDPNLFQIREEEVYDIIEETGEFIEQLYAPKARPDADRAQA
jgi:hypothetical protein